MKKIFATIFCVFTVLLFTKAQILYGPTRQGGDENSGTIGKFNPSTNSLSTAKSFESFANGPQFTHLIQATNGKLYGMTYYSSNGYGVIFSWDPSSNSYNNLKYFDNTNGANPYGSLMQANDGKLYGTTGYGGSYGRGVIFSFDPSNNNYSKLQDFDGTNGANPYGNLVQVSDGKLYGMTVQGGNNDAGVIFSFDPSSNSYSKLKDLDNTNGGNPYGSLVQANDGKLYGMTRFGGSNSNGVIFSYDPTNNTYSKLKDFDNTSGRNPNGSLVQAGDGKLYGMATSGGSSGSGVIFSFDPSIGIYSKLKDLDNVSGVFPYGSLVVANNGSLYGLTVQGGSIGTGVIFSWNPSTNTYSKLKDFDNANGRNPYGSLVQANDGKLYGMTSAGGNGGRGVIFSYDPAANNYVLLKDFGSNNTGSYASGTLVHAGDGNLYGLTAEGGNNGYGVIYAYNPSSNSYNKLKDFDNINGRNPFGSLMQATDGKLYGMTQSGGNSNYGVIFSWDPSSNTFNKLKDFDYTNGGYPWGNLIQTSNGKLYGVTASGGSSGYGVIFSFDPSNNSYNKLKDFNTADGLGPFGSLTQASDGKLYGMTVQGGSSGYGVIYSYDPSSNTFSKLKDFDNASGGYPYGNLIQASDGKLYGMTYVGGSSGAGVIFSWDPASNTYSKFKDFDNTSGGYPLGSLMQASNGKLYGMTNGGGNYGRGVIFSYDPATLAFSKLQDYNGANGAYPYIGSAFIEPNSCPAISVNAVASNLAAGTVLSKTMSFGVAGDVQFTGQGPGAKTGTGRTNIYSGINNASYTGLWWTFTPIENPRHSSQTSSTGQMVFNNYNAATGIITFTSTANMTWAANSGTENIATRVRMQLQPYSGVHTGPLSSGWITPVTAGGISLASLPSAYPLIDIKALGATGAYQVWYIVETASGVPLDDYYASYPHTSIVGGQTITSLTGSFFYAAPSTCNGGPASVNVTASGGTAPYTGTGNFLVSPGQYTYTVTDANGCSGSTTITVSPQNCVSLTCIADQTVNTDVGSCAAIVVDLDPVINPTNAAVHYTMSGATNENGTGSVSGKSFNRGVTLVTYTAVDDPAKTCSFSVTVKDEVKPTVHTQDITVQLDANGAASITAAQINNGSTDNCTAAADLQLSLDKTSFDCSNIGANTVTLTVTDAYGNSESATATVTVKDEVKPVVHTQDITLQLDASGAASITAAQINDGSTDNCTAAADLQLSLDKTSFDCSNIGANTVTLTVTDAYGNSESATATITVEDKIKPVASCKAIDVYLDMDGTVTITPQDVDNGSFDNCSVSLSIDKNSFNSSHVGDNTVTLTATDPSGNSSSCAATVTVKKRPVIITYTGDGSEQYSDKQTLSAVLTDQLTGTFLSGKSINFTIGTQSVSTTTNIAGLATGYLTLTQDPAPVYTVVSSFAGDNIYLPGSDNDVFDILQEDARAYYTGALFASTSGSSSSSAVVTLSATIQDITAVINDPAYDPNMGDIRNATVSFIDRDNGNTIIATVPVSLVNSGDVSTATALYNWTTDIGNADSKQFTIGIKVNNYYLRNSSDDNAVVTVSKPLDDFITGGGYIILEKSAGQLAGKTGTKNNFGFNAKFNKKGKNLQGNINSIFRRMGNDGLLHVYQVKGNAMTSMGIDGSTTTQHPFPTATFNGKANLQDITDPNNPISLGGNLTLQVTMTDRGDPGANDDIGITIWNNAGSLLYSSNWSGVNTANQLLAGGNLKVTSGANASLQKTSESIVYQKSDAKKLSAQVFPNPSPNAFTVITESNNDAPLKAIITDVQGKVLESIQGIRANGRFEVGGRYRPGVYYLQVLQGDERILLKLVKQSM